MSGATTNASRFLVVRHGQSTWNAASKRQGQADPPLSPLGAEQAELAAKAIDRADLVWSSDLERANHTARILTARCVTRSARTDLACNYLAGVQPDPQPQVHTIAVVNVDGNILW